MVPRTNTQATPIMDISAIVVSLMMFSPFSKAVLALHALPLIFFQNHREALSSSHTEGNQSAAQIPVSQFIDEPGSQNTAAGSVGVSDRDGSPVDIDPRHILGVVEAHLLQ